MKYFIDTSFLVGLANTRDKFHDAANDILDQISATKSAELIISDYVIDEFINFMLRVSRLDEAIQWGELLFSEEFISIYYSNQDLILSAWKLIQSEMGERKPLTFTDCVVFLSAQKLACDEILTFDDRLKNYKT